MGGTEPLKIEISHSKREVWFFDLLLIWYKIRSWFVFGTYFGSAICVKWNMQTFPQKWQKIAGLLERFPLHDLSNGKLCRINQLVNFCGVSRCINRAVETAPTKSSWVEIPEDRSMHRGFLCMTPWHRSAWIMSWSWPYGSVSSFHHRSSWLASADYSMECHPIQCFDWVNISAGRDWTEDLQNIFVGAVSTARFMHRETPQKLTSQFFS